MSNDKQIEKHLELPHQETIVGINTIQTKPFDNQKITKMTNNKQSSVEWFSKESWNLKVKLENKEITIGEYGVTYVDLLNQAKAMHKVEVVNAVDGFPIHTRHMDGEEYYNETFGGNNEH